MLIALRTFAGLGCLTLGMAATYSLYVATDSGSPAYLMRMTAVAALISLCSFGLSRVLLRSWPLQAVMGAIGSYMAMLATLLIVSHIRGEMAETQMWLPIIILFGVPFMAPLVAMSGLAAFLITQRSTRPRGRS